MISADCDLSHLDEFINSLDEAKRSRALKSGFRRLANDTLKRGRANVGASGVNSNRDLEKGMRAPVFKRRVGFRVTVGAKAGKGGKEVGMYINRYGVKKPVLTFLEAGSKSDRVTKTHKEGKRTRFVRKRDKHRTGKLRAYHFMEMLRPYIDGDINDRMHELVTDSFKRAAKKYGNN